MSNKLHEYLYTTLLSGTNPPPTTMTTPPTTMTTMTTMTTATTTPGSNYISLTYLNT